MASPATRRMPTPTSLLDSGRKRLAAALRAASFDQLTREIPPEIATLLGAASVRVYLRDPLTEELYTRYARGARVRESRFPVDPSSVVGYAAMTRTHSFAWKKDTETDKRYVIASPLLKDGELRGIVELIHGRVNTAVEDDRRGVFYDLVGHMGRRLQELDQTGEHGTPYDFLLKGSLVTPEALREARDRAAKGGHSVEHVLIVNYGVEKAALGRSLSEHFGVPFTAVPAQRPISPDLLGKFSPSFLKTHAVLPVSWKGNAVEVIVANPGNLQVLDDIGRQAGSEKLVISVAVREDILAGLSKFAGLNSPKPDAPAGKKSSESGGEWEAVAPLEPGYNLAEPEDMEIDSGAVRLVNETIQAAVDSGASDIHFEPTSSGGLVIRFRVDGVCHDFRIVKEPIARSVVSRVKIMSNLNIAEHRLPQDGKIMLRDKKGRRADLRVAIVPTQGAQEDVVLRLLPEYQVFELQKLGMDEETVGRFRKSIEQPHGIILCVGPTGSGKTTTLHAALSHLKGPQVKIWTAEDPVEITQEGVRQVQMHHQVGLTFERALRAFLRCDPDIIMIGEIRDRETADAAVEASLTGHLVLSTLHTNSAPETVTRLLEMGLDPFTFANSLRGVLAQRLVRRICDGCTEKYPASREEVEELRQRFGDDARFDALCPDRKKLTLVRGKGCPACFSTGYKGRLGIHEFLSVTPAVRRLIQKKAEADDVAAQGRQEGLVNLKQDGIRKILKGKTDLKEVISMTLEENI